MIGRFGDRPPTWRRSGRSKGSEELALEVAAFGVRVAIVSRASPSRRSSASPPHAQRHWRTPRTERLSEFYGTGYVNATDAVDVANVILQAIETDDPQLRYIVSWAATELTAGRWR